MSYYNYSILFFQIYYKVFNLRRRYRVKSACRLIHKKNIGFNCQGTSYTKPLLLSSRKSEGRFFQPVFRFIPYSRASQRPFNYIIKLCLVSYTMRSGTIGNIVVNAHRKRIGLLEYHSYFPSQFIHICCCRENVFILVSYVTFDDYPGYQVVHPVESF